jgi:flagellar biosynthesis anti-sigma factor FlgM
MKIVPSVATTAVAPTSAEPRPAAPAEKRAEGGARVSLSDDAKWIASVAEESRKAPTVRQDVVEKTRQMLADGTYEQSVDLSSLVDRLLADL